MTKKNFKLAIVSGKGGVGKSMLSSALATLFAQEKKIIAVDADVDAPNLAIWLNEFENWQKTIPVTTSYRPEINYQKCDGCGICAQKCQFSAIKMENGKPKLNRFLCEGCGVCELVCPKKAIQLKPVQNGEIKVKKVNLNSQNYFTLISGHLFVGETGSGKIVSEIKKYAEENEDYELMLIDSAPGTGCPVIASIQDVDLAVLVTEPTPSGLADFKKVLKVIKHFGIPFKTIINKWDINPKISQQIEKEFKEFFLGKISYDQGIFKAIANLKPILETDLQAKKELTEIYQNLREEII